jgi:hypothetical protein
MAIQNDNTVNPQAPKTWTGNPVNIKKESQGGAPGKALDALNTYATGPEYSSPHNYDVGQQDEAKSRSR